MFNLNYTILKTVFQEILTKIIYTVLFFRGNSDIMNFLNSTLSYPLSAITAFVFFNRISDSVRISSATSRSPLLAGITLKANGSS